MIPTFAESFVDLIEKALLEASRGIASLHHLHNVRGGITNILSLLEYDAEIGAAADRLTQPQLATSIAMTPSQRQ
jgi:hypothetical protein